MFLTVPLTRQLFIDPAFVPATKPAFVPFLIVEAATVQSEISDEFREIFSAHDFIISKGMGNYEGLTEIDLSSKEVFFLLCSKCTTISKNIGVNLHDMLLLKNRN